MNQAISTTRAYVLGRTDAERRRLAEQGSILDPHSERFLRSAGLGPGMRVLDLGCGIGSVSLIAARLVGPAGHVTGIELDGAALGVASQRAYEMGLPQVAFEQGDFLDHHPTQLYDAVVARHVFIHVADVPGAMRHAVSLLRKGGIAAFEEWDLSTLPAAYPEARLFTQSLGLVVELFRRASPHADIGMRLFQLMREVGLTRPECRAECLLDGGPESPFHEWLAATLRSVLPKLEALGLASGDELRVDSLADRLREESAMRQGSIATPLIVTAFARK